MGGREGRGMEEEEMSARERGRNITNAMPCKIMVQQNVKMNQGAMSSRIRSDIDTVCVVTNFSLPR